MTVKQVLSEMQQIRNNAAYFQSAVYRYKTFMNTITDAEKEQLKKESFIIELDEQIVKICKEIEQNIKAI